MILFHNIIQVFTSLGKATNSFMKKVIIDTYSDTYLVQTFISDNKSTCKHQRFDPAGHELLESNWTKVRERTFCISKQVYMLANL